MANGGAPEHPAKLTYYCFYYVHGTILYQVFYIVIIRLSWTHAHFPNYSYLSLFTSWVQGTTRHLLASITIVDYTGTIGGAITVSLPASLHHCTQCSIHTLSPPRRW